MDYDDLPEYMRVKAPLNEKHVEPKQEYVSPFYEEQEKDISPQEEIELLNNWTQPKAKHLLLKDQKKGFMEAITQDVLTGFYDDKDKEVVLDYLNLCTLSLEISRMHDLNLSGAYRHFRNVVINIASTSKGYNGNIIKALMTRYNIEERIERRKELEEQEPETVQKSPNFNFFGSTQKKPFGR